MAQVYAKTLNILVDHIVLFEIVNGRMLTKCKVDASQIQLG